MKKGEFPCSSCGQCCSHIGTAINNGHSNELIDKMLKEFPYDVNKDGSCSMLDEDGKCTVYYSRPDLCNIDKMYELVYKKEFKNIEDFYILESKACNKMIRGAGLDSKYLVKIQ